MLITVQMIKFEQQSFALEKSIDSLVKTEEGRSDLYQRHGISPIINLKKAKKKGCAGKRRANNQSQQTRKQLTNPLVFFLTKIKL